MEKLAVDGGKPVTSRDKAKRLVTVKTGIAMEKAKQIQKLIKESKLKVQGSIQGDLVRVATEIGYFVDKVWVTEGIRPGVVACSHHMGRWKLEQGDEKALDQQLDQTRKAIIEALKVLSRKGRERASPRLNAMAFDNPFPKTFRWALLIIGCEKSNPKTFL